MHSIIRVRPELQAAPLIWFAAHAVASIMRPQRNMMTRSKSLTTTKTAASASRFLRALPLLKSPVSFLLYPFSFRHYFGGGLIIFRVRISWSPILAGLLQVASFSPTLGPTLGRTMVMLSLQLCKRLGLQFGEECPSLHFVL